jgi:nucleoside-diphosphate-sugar epimerase
VTIIITGGTGFIGSFLAIGLLESTDEDLMLLDYYINEKRIKSIKKNPRISIIKADVSNREEIFFHIGKIRDISTIYHFGSLMPPLTESEPTDAFNINIQGTFNILECARKFSIPQVIYSSSGAIYGPGVELPVRENSYRDPWTMYGVGKVCSEVLGTFYHRRKGVKFTSIRFPALIGPGRTGKGMTIFANNIIQYPAQGEKAVCNVEEDIAVPIIYVKDSTKLLVSLHNQENIPENTYNIDGIWVKAEELAEYVQKVIPEAEIEYNPDPELTFMLRNWSMMKGESNAVFHDLGYSPSFSPKEIVRDFIAEVRANPDYKI